MTTRVRPKPESAQPVGQTGLDLILCAVRGSVGNTLRNKADSRLRRFPLSPPDPPASPPPFRLRQTKPNLGRVGYLGVAIQGGVCAKRSQFPAGPGLRGAGTRGRCAKRTQSAWRGRAAVPRLGQGDSAKQSQFARGRASGGDAQPTKSRLRQTKPNLGKMGDVGVLHGGRLCQTNPIPGCAGRDEGQMRQTNPIPSKAECGGASAWSETSYGE
jgi:hypothetical protein